jgi:hypothetical protein
VIAENKAQKNCNSSAVQNLAALPHFPKLSYVFDCIMFAPKLHIFFAHFMFAHLRKERTKKSTLIYNRGKKYRRQAEQLLKQFWISFVLSWKRARIT